MEKQAEVGIAGANALGQMGGRGAGDVNIGAGGGFNPAAMMAGMALGGAVGTNIAKTMNSMMENANPPAQNSIVPPPVPTVMYHVADKGQETGPFDMSTLSQMAITGKLNAESLVWKAGMAQWEKAGTIDELKEIFRNVPPVPPTE